MRFSFYKEKSLAAEFMGVPYRRFEPILEVPVTNRGTKNPESFHKLFNVILLIVWKGRQILSKSLSFPIQNTIFLYYTRFLFSTCGSHLTTYPMGIGGCFPRDKEAGK